MASLFIPYKNRGKRQRLPRWVQIVFSLLLVGLLAGHLYKPKLAIVSISLGLLVLVTLLWIVDRASTVELPGGTKIKFEQVAQAIEKVLGDPATSERPIDRAGPAVDLPVGASTGEGLDVGDPQVEQYTVPIDEPSLVLVSIRIEIERRVRKFAESRGINRQMPLTRLLRALHEQGRLPADVYDGLADLVTLGNLAAHGGAVDPQAVEWASAQASAVLALLDHYLA